MDGTVVHVQHLQVQVDPVGGESVGDRDVEGVGGHRLEVQRLHQQQGARDGVHHHGAVGRAGGNGEEDRGVRLRLRVHVQLRSDGRADGRVLSDEASGGGALDESGREGGVTVRAEVRLVHVDNEREGSGEGRRAAVRGQHAEGEAVRRDCGLFRDGGRNRRGKVACEHHHA